MLQKWTQTSLCPAPSYLCFRWSVSRCHNFTGANVRPPDGLRCSKSSFVLRGGSLRTNKKTILSEDLGKKCRPHSAWRAVSCKCSMNGWPEYGMPIRIEIMRSLVTSLQTPSCWKILCGYKTESKEQLCPVDFVVLFFFFHLKYTSCQSFASVLLCDGLWLSVLMSWLRAQLYSPLNCSSSILLMMGRVVMSWCKISGCIQWHGILRTPSVGSAVAVLRKSESEEM